jgi:Zn-finger nucleic acid-binding protein
MKKILTCPNCGYSFDAAKMKFIINTDCPKCRKVAQTDFILKFEKKLLDNIKYSDPEFSQVVDDNFWDLI